MFTKNTLEKIILSTTAVAMLFFLGACSRPENAMVAEFQQLNNAILTQYARNVATARGLTKKGRRAVSNIRGFSGGSNSTTVGRGYHNNYWFESVLCLILAHTSFKDIATYDELHSKIGVLSQCMTRLILGGTRPLSGSASGLMGPLGLGLLQFVSDARGGGEFSSAYGLDSLGPLGFPGLLGFGGSFGGDFGGIGF